MLEDEELPANEIDQGRGEGHGELSNEAVDPKLGNQHWTCGETSGEADGTDHGEVKELPQAAVSTGGENPEDVRDVGENVAEAEGDDVTQGAAPGPNFVRDIMVERCGEDPLGTGEPNDLMGDEGTETTDSVFDELEGRMGIAIFEPLNDCWDIVGS